jgi:hypothetical protein
MAPYIEEKPTLADFIKSLKSGTQEFQGMGPQMFVHTVYELNELITLAPSNMQNNEFLGIALNKKEELIAYGQFKEIELSEKISVKDRLLSYEHSYYLNGLGVGILEEEYSEKKTKMFMNKRIVYSGEFSNNQLHGEGCKSIEGDKTVYGKFCEGSIRSADVVKMSESNSDEIKRLIMKRMKTVHIHSLKFCNNYSNERPILVLQNFVKISKAKNPVELEQ